MLVTEPGMLTDASMLQDRKAELPMLLTESGKLTDDRFAQGIHGKFTPLGLLPCSSSSPNPRHDGKAELPMLVTEFGMLTDARLLQ